MNYFYGLFAAVLLTTLLVPVATRIGLRFGIVDMPNGRKIHTEPVPRTGGAALIVGTLAPFVFLSQDAPLNMAFGAGAAVLFVFGVLDDARDIHYAWKFLGQVLAASTVIWLSGLRFQTCGILCEELTGPLAPFRFPLAVFVLLVTTNCINLSDGLDGLASGVSLLSFAAVGFLSFLQQDIPTAVLCLSAMGALLGFLRYNTHPATVFLGDTGSQFLGFTAGFSLMLLTQGCSSYYSPFLPLYLIGVPLIDTTLVFCERILTGHSPFRADKQHLHHRLLRLGVPHGYAVVVIYMLQLGLIVLGFTLRESGDWVLLLTYLALLSTVVVFFLVPGKTRRIEELGGDWIKTHDGSEPIEPKHWLTRMVLIRIAWPTMLLGLALFWLVTSLSIPVVQRDLGVISAILPALFLVILVLSPELKGSILRICAYFLTIYLVLAWEFQFHEFPKLLLDRGFYDGIFLVMGGAYFFFVLVSLEKIPLLTMDYLLLAVVIFTFFLPEDILRSYPVHSVSARVFLVFLCVELIAFRREGFFSVIGTSAMAALGILALRAFVR